MLTSDAGVAVTIATHGNGDEMKTVRIKITRSTVCSGKSVARGDIIDASKRDAQLLFAMGKAVPAGEQKKAPRGEK